MTSSETGDRNEEDPGSRGSWTIDGVPCRVEVELTLFAGRWQADRVKVHPIGRPREGAGAPDLAVLRARAAMAVEEAFNHWLTTHQEQVLDLLVHLLGSTEKVAEDCLALAEEEVRLLKRRARTARAIRKELVAGP